MDITLWILDEDADIIGKLVNPTTDEAAIFCSTALQLGRKRDLSLEVEGPNFYERIFDSTGAENLGITHAATISVRTSMLMTRYHETIKLMAQDEEAS